MLKVIFFLKAEKVGKNGESPIFARISYKTKRISMSTGKSISKERWAFTSNLRNVLKLEKEKVIKNSLDLFQIHAEKKFIELFKMDPEVSLELLKAEIAGKTKIKTKHITILEVLEKHNAFFARKVEAGERSKASFQKYERSTHLLKSFIKKQYGLDNMPAADVSNGFVFTLEEYLKYESSFKGQVGIKNNSVVKYMKMYKTACNYCIRMDLIIKNPFDAYNGKLNVKDAVFLTQQELNRIEEKTITIERLEKVRDIFLFCCYTGYAPIDALKLSHANLFEDNDGNLWIMTNRTKTTIRENVPVLPPALAIINKYKEKQMSLLPQISNQKMNAYLKEIADICGINKHLTWYVSRHTFATTVTLGNGVRLEHVSAMMGHSNIKQTQHYAKVLDVNIMEDMEKLKLRYK
ncbi:tyrosine-type recombinase/integrase [uncultured Flavobacterium sp.]|uniref:site-specific integrase n=1 Tax=uncultured Flavobacterium sp. TaxID=165435 RepID=UPI0029317C4C|nr:tyrosine-type recombinase/integrase [uncultured Flavobacterium sp.]